MSHNNQLRHQAHSLRKQVLERHDHRCFCCGVPENQKERLQLHHILPIARGGMSTLDNLIPLCPSCHAKIHKDWERKLPIPEGLMK